MFHSAKYLVFCVICFSNFNGYCHAQFIEQQADILINELYHSIKSTPNDSSISKRLNWFSEQFKNSIYVLGSLGEGAKGRYDQFPLYRTDAFDCDTYVNTVVALALSNSLKNFRHCVSHLRYNDGKVSYINRNHFTSVDWNKSHQNKGLFQDVTLNIHNQNNKSVAKYASTLIDKPSWYAHKTISTIRIEGQDKALQKQRLAELKRKSKVLDVRTSKLPYIPLRTLFPQPNKPNLYLFSQIPNGAIIEIVRPNWDLRDKIGTNLDISHLGFAFWHKKTLYFRQASSQYGKVVDVPLITYLREALASPTIKGINIQIVLPQKPGYCGS